MSLLQHNPTIKSKIQELWNKFWSGGISNPLTAIEQITYLLFMKKLDENDTAQTTLVCRLSFLRSQLFSWFRMSVLYLIV